MHNSRFEINHPHQDPSLDNPLACTNGSVARVDGAEDEINRVAIPKTQALRGRLGTRGSCEAEEFLERRLGRYRVVKLLLLQDIQDGDPCKVEYFFRHDEEGGRGCGGG
jgi:hypothetical protein